MDFFDKLLHKDTRPRPLEVTAEKNQERMKKPWPDANELRRMRGEPLKIKNEVDGKIIEYTIVDPAQEYARLQSKEVRLHKFVPVLVYVSPGGERITTPQDGRTYITDKGDMIIANPDEASYRYGNGEDSVERRQQKYRENYDEDPTRPAEMIAVDGLEKPVEAKYYIKSQDVIAVPVEGNITFSAKGNDRTFVEVGGYLTRELYTISPSSVSNYEIVPNN